MSDLAETNPIGESPAPAEAALPDTNGTDRSSFASVPNVARIYDYLLGGKNNFESDRLAAARLARIIPDIPTVCRHNRQFLQRAVWFLAAEQGIRQFIDIGTGLPTQGNVHETAQVIDPNTRVLYVDNDPLVVSHAQALLVNAPTVVAINRDLRQPRQIIEHPALQALIDLDKPVAILLIAILHFIPDKCDVYGIVDDLKAAMPPGSYLALSHATGDNVPIQVTEQVRDLYGETNAPAAPRTRTGIARFFKGLNMVGPGLVPVSAWPFRVQRAEPSRAIFLAGVGRKP